MRLTADRKEIHHDEQGDSAHGQSPDHERYVHIPTLKEQRNTGFLGLLLGTWAQRRQSGRHEHDHNKKQR